MLTAADRVVIVGAGQAGAWAARTLRDEGFSGEVVMIGAEAHMPYERPPLSKEALLTDPVASCVWVLPEEEYRAAHIDVRRGVMARAIDRGRRLLHTTAGEAITYSRLILCTGGRARRLSVPADERVTVHGLRTLEDAQALHAALRTARSAVIVGGGWIGLEVAAAARQLGVEVTLLEAAPRLCARVLPPELSAWLEARHAAQGVRVRCSATLRGIRMQDGRPQIDLGDELMCTDLVVAGVGLEPNDELARAAGLEVDGGIVVDAGGRTSDPDILAAGDVTNAPNSCHGGRLRLESWQNAQQQAAVAARTALGIEARHDPVPWFWSEQYGTRLQILGFPVRGERAVARGALEDQVFTVFYLQGRRVSAAVSHDSARDFRVARTLIERQVDVDPELLADPAGGPAHDPNWRLSHGKR